MEHLAFPGGDCQRAAAGSMHYDAYLFIHAIRNRYWLGMLAAVDAALSGATGARRDSASRNVDAGFLRFLLGTRDYLMSEGRVRPDGMKDDEFLLLKPLCEHLVASGRFPLKRLDLFRDIDPWRLPAPAQRDQRPERPR